MTLTEKLAALKITLPTVPGPFGAYVPARRFGYQLWVSGQLPINNGTLLASGPVPSACSIEQARLGARQCVINALAAAKAVEGTIDALNGVVRVGAFIWCDPGFTEQPVVANAASELLLELFGDPGRHARAAVGTNALPLGASVEIEFLFGCRELRSSSATAAP
jgi:enamine deaminase RidA (YjgF/YER057c/UK114 family)